MCTRRSRKEPAGHLRRRRSVHRGHRVDLREELRRTDGVRCRLKQGKAVWNLGVASYSPADLPSQDPAGRRATGLEAHRDLRLSRSVGHRRRRECLQGRSGRIRELQTPFHWFHIGQFLLGNFATFRLAYDLYLSPRRPAPWLPWDGSVAAGLSIRLSWRNGAGADWRLPATISTRSSPSAGNGIAA